jgi:hypothetical protein
MNNLRESKVPRQPDQQTVPWSPTEEHKLVRRIDKRLMPLLVITYGLQYYDKVMLSQAAGELRPSRSQD